MGPKSRSLARTPSRAGTRDGVPLARDDSFGVGRDDFVKRRKLILLVTFAARPLGITGGLCAAPTERTHTQLPRVGHPQNLRSPRRPRDDSVRAMVLDERERSPLLLRIFL